MCPLKSESCVFKNVNGSVILRLYVDDSIVVGKDCRVADLLLEGLEREFETRFLGMEIMRNEKGLHLNQTGRMAQLLEAYNMTEAKPAPIPANCLFLTRPDISYAVNRCSRRVENPTEEDVVSIKRVLRYLRCTEHLGIRFGGSSPTEQLVGFYDANFAGDPQSRRNTTGYVTYYCGGPIIWSIRKQPMVALSTEEAEYIADAECTKELMYLKAFLDEILGKEVTARLHVDNQSALILKNGVLNRRSKHIDVQFHYIHKKVSEGLVKVHYCHSGRQKADIFTKLLPGVKFKTHLSEIVCRELHRNTENCKLGGSVGNYHCV
ncbi:hypothetical protein PR048_003708 [Dryococelus australis]|uniref:Reverse transcriptase Ty1/copia-type domain-containing protein n=1 Tax=Dryococelus australis TaxID=614101 RepID=A0ABQ9INV4_9NEOP|nr:hypothetical protein PR048_003708 [Dryococelus australis]